MTVNTPLNQDAQHPVDSAVLQRNFDFFLENIETYKQHAETLDTYVRLRELVNSKLGNINQMIDVGNGGVFDYDTTALGRITAVDIFFDQLPPKAFEYFPSNCSPECGSALNLPYDDETFDGGINVMLLHHLVGKRVKDNFALLRRAISELYRVIKPGGRMIIAESCVPTWFYYPEIVAFETLSSVINRIGKHPVTFQYTPKIIENTIRDICGNCTVDKSTKGRWILQFGLKFPSVLTPANQYVFVADKPL